MRRLFSACTMLSVMALVLGFIATPVASAQQSINLYVGGFVPRAEDGRSHDDVLVNNLGQGGLLFDISDFHSATFGAEYLVGLADKFEAGLGIGYQQKSVPSIYADVINANGAEIEQTLKLRLIPFTATLRFLPLGHGSVQPYVGAGVGVFGWRYSETGEFVDQNNVIFRGNFVGSGSATGPVFLGGVRAPLGSVGLGFELKWQRAEGDLPASENFAGPKIDLGGVNYTFLVNFRF
jgi:hypothetical protein